MMSKFIRHTEATRPQGLNVLIVEKKQKSTQKELHPHGESLQLCYMGPYTVSQVDSSPCLYKVSQEDKWKEVHPYSF